MKEKGIYIVVSVSRDDSINVVQTRKHSRMMKAVKEAIATKSHYTVLRQSL